MNSLSSLEISLFIIFLFKKLFKSCLEGRSKAEILLKLEPSKLLFLTFISEEKFFFILFGELSSSSLASSALFGFKISFGSSTLLMFLINESLLSEIELEFRPFTLLIILHFGFRFCLVSLFGLFF